MCLICSADEKERQTGKDHEQQVAEDLRELAAISSMLASGLIKPHSEAVSRGKLLAHTIIRELVNEWM